MSTIETKIGEILGFSRTQSPDSTSQTRAYFVTAESPEKAEEAFLLHADSLAPPEGMELGEVALNEEKNGIGLFFGTIAFKTPTPKIKRDHGGGVFEIYGEKVGSTRKSATHERSFRIKAESAREARDKLETFIRETAETSGRLHLDGIDADEEQDGNGFYAGRVTYSNPENKGDSDFVVGCVEAYGNRYTIDKKSKSAEHVFELSGYDNVKAACEALAEIHGSDLGVESIEAEEDSGGADRIYAGRVRYVRERDDEEEDDNQASLSFEISGSQTKKTCSISTRGAYGLPGKSVRNYRGLIGVTDEGVEGVDTDTPVTSFTKTVYMPAPALTVGFIKTLGAVYGHVNTLPFLGYAAGELRFLGASGAYRRGDKTVEISYKFAYSPNETNIKIGDITIPFKYGWDYAWVRWGNVIEKDGTGSDAKEITVKVPIAAYVEQVFQVYDFNSLMGSL